MFHTSTFWTKSFWSTFESKAQRKVPTIRSDSRNKGLLRSTHTVSLPPLRLVLERITVTNITVLYIFWLFRCSSSPFGIAVCSIMGKGQEGAKMPEEFTWVETDEPHRSRRIAMLQKYPEVCCMFLSVSVCFLRISSEQKNPSISMFVACVDLIVERAVC